MEKKERKTNLELIRILSIILIILHHFGIHGEYNQISNISNRIFIDFTILGGKIGVNLFILLTGHFMIENKWKVKKIIKIVLQTVFYSITILIIFKILGFANINKKEIYYLFTPIIHSTYWFITVYLLLYLMIPFINKFLNQLTQIEYQKFIIIMVTIQSIIPTMFIVNNLLGDIGWFILLYSIAAYIKKYPNKYFENKKQNMKIAIILFIVLFIITVFLDYIKIINQFHFCNMNSIIVLVISICIFLWFNKIQIKNSNIINTISQSVLGIYLIHEHPYMRKFLWKYLFSYENITETWKLIIFTISSIFLTFIFCLIIEQIRKNTIEKLEEKAIKYIKEKI